MHGRGRRSHLQALEFANTSKIVGELFDFARTIRVKSTAEAQGIADKKKGHRVFANGFQILAVQCLLQGRVCSDVAAHLDFAQFQSLQNGNMSKKVVDTGIL